METVSRLVLTNQCPVCLAVYGDRKAAHRHLLSSLRRWSCRDRSRYLGQVHIPQSLCCPICSAEPGNWSELQLHLAEHLNSVFNGFRNAGMGETQVGRGSAKSGSAEKSAIDVQPMRRSASKLGKHGKLSPSSSSTSSCSLSSSTRSAWQTCAFPRPKSTSLTGYEPKLLAFDELYDSSVSFSLMIPSSDQDMDDLTLGEMLTAAHRGQEAVSQSVVVVCNVRWIRAT